MSLTLLALAAALSGAAPDPATDNEADLRCVAVIASIIGSTSTQGEARAGLFGGAMFFVGRIEGRSPDYDLKGGLVRLASQPDFEAILTADRQRCGKIMMARGDLMKDVGSALGAAGH